MEQLNGSTSDNSKTGHIAMEKKKKRQEKKKKNSGWQLKLLS